MTFSLSRKINLFSEKLSLQYKRHANAYKNIQKMTLNDDKQRENPRTRTDGLRPPTRTHAHIRAHEVNVLIACEESQAECKAFRDLGFNAYSCDIQPCRPSGNPSWHIHGDVKPYLMGETAFTTQDGEYHEVEHWHLIIAHPPCTYLCKCGSVQMWNGGVINVTRFGKMLEGRIFFMLCLYAQADFVAVENPLPQARARLPKPSCFIQPSWFGVKYTKKTLYWTRNLPPLMPTIEYPNPKCYVRSSRGKYRSRTFQQVAEAIADQWGRWVLECLAEKD